MARQKARARGRPRKKIRKDTGSEYLYAEGIAGMMRIRCERTALRWQKAITRATSYQFPPGLNIVEHMEDALAAMNQTVLALSKVPKSWKPAVGAVGGPLLEEGSMVEIREKHRDLYPFVPDTTRPLRIAAIHGTRILCEVPSKNGAITQTVFPKSHVRRAQEEV